MVNKSPAQAEFALNATHLESGMVSPTSPAWPVNCWKYMRFYPNRDQSQRDVSDRIRRFSADTPVGPGNCPDAPPEFDPPSAFATARANADGPDFRRAWQDPADPAAAALTSGR
jgi:hypothetical protein